MLTIDDYIDRAKSIQNMGSDNKLAKELGISSPSLNQYRSKRSWPSDATMIKLADLCDLDRGQALMFLNIWRSKDQTAKNQYEEMANDYQKNHPQIMQMMISAPFKTNQPAEQRAE